MRRVVLLFSFMSLMYPAYNQVNLVPNYSFEDSIKCINCYDEFNGYVADWFG